MVFGSCFSVGSYLGVSPLFLDVYPHRMPAGAVFSTADQTVRGKEARKLNENTAST